MNDAQRATLDQTMEAIAQRLTNQGVNRNDPAVMSGVLEGVGLVGGILDPFVDDHVRAILAGLRLNLKELQP